MQGNNQLNENTPERQDELEQWLNETTSKHADVLRRLAEEELDFIARVRADIKRYYSALKRLAD